MNSENVLPFEASSRRAMARRGSPDKALRHEVLEVQCPYCDAVLSLESGFPDIPAEVLCTDCRLVIDLDDCGMVDSRG